MIGIGATLLLCLGVHSTAAHLEGLGATGPEELLAVLLDKPGTPEQEEAFKKIYNYFHENFDHDAYAAFVQDFTTGAEDYGKTDVYRGVEAVPHCDTGVSQEKLVTPLHTTHLAAFPGGSARKTFGFDLGKLAVDTLKRATGPAATQSAASQIVGLSALMMSKSLIQSTVATVASVVPPSIPPPVWNNMPLPCLPMVTGHNCFGSITYPITFSDFVLADVTDSVMDGVKASFPSNFAKKAGRTSDAVYDRCYKAFMSMQCVSLFPMCTTLQAREEAVPGLGRAPICFPLCLNVLVQCPGFWVDDISGPCNEMSVPPMCAFGYYTRTDTKPAQLSSFEQASLFPKECPSYDPSLDLGRDPKLLDVLPISGESWTGESAGDLQKNVPYSS